MHLRLFSYLFLDRSSVCESMCLIKPRLATPSLPWMPLNLLQSLHHSRFFIYIPQALFEEFLRWGGYIFRVSLL